MYVHVLAKPNRDPGIDAMEITIMKKKEKSVKQRDQSALSLPCEPPSRSGK
jgi:hypothetical protein